MKRNIYLAIGIFLLLMMSYKLWAYFHDKKFVEENLTTYTKIKDFKVKNKYFDDQQSYIEVTISNSDKIKLLNKFKFESTFEKKLKGEAQCNFISEKKAFVYYLDLDRYGPYGYILFAVEKDGNTLELYEMYGN
jgi:hypothetical protein